LWWRQKSPRNTLQRCTLRIYNTHDNNIRYRIIYLQMFKSVKSSYITIKQLVFSQASNRMIHGCCILCIIKQHWVINIGNYVVVNIGNEYCILLQLNIGGGALSFKIATKNLGHFAGSEKERFECLIFNLFYVRDSTSRLTSRHIVVHNLTGVREQSWESWMAVRGGLRATSEILWNHICVFRAYSSRRRGWGGVSFQSRNKKNRFVLNGPRSL